MAKATFLIFAIAVCLLVSVESQSMENQNYAGCSKTITKEFKPICASDGITYTNKPLFECAKRFINPSLTVIREGTCQFYTSTWFQYPLWNNNYWPNNLIYI